MSEPSSISKLFPCRKCGQQVMVNYTPNETHPVPPMIELLTCDNCLPKNKKRKPLVQARLPYAD